MRAKALRKLKSGHQYDHLFPKPNFRTVSLSQGINVKDTIKYMIETVDLYHTDTQKLAPLLKGATLKDTCRNIWNFVYDHIQYKLDKSGIEQLRRPAYLWAVRATEGGDCDCYAIFILSVLRNLNIPCKIRVTKYKRDWQHVYVIVPNGRENIVIDCVLDNFNQEVPFSGNIDTDPNMPTHRLDGLGEYAEDLYLQNSDFEGLGFLKKKKPNGKADESKKYEAEIRAFIANTGQLSPARFAEIKAKSPSLYVKYRAQLDAKFGGGKLTKKEERKLKRAANKDIRQTKRDSKAVLKNSLPRGKERKDALKRLRENTKALKKDNKGRNTGFNPLAKLRQKIQDKKMQKKGGTTTERDKLEEKIKLGQATREDALLIRSKYSPLWKKYKKQLQALIASDLKTNADIKQDEIKTEIEAGKDPKQAEDLINSQDKGDAEEEEKAVIPAPANIKLKPTKELEIDEVEEPAIDMNIAEQGIKKAQDAGKKRALELKTKAEEAIEEAADETIDEGKQLLTQKGKTTQTTAKTEDGIEDATEVDDAPKEPSFFEKNKTMIIGGAAAVAVIGIAAAVMGKKNKPLSGVKSRKRRKKSKSTKNTNKKKSLKLK